MGLVGFLHTNDADLAHGNLMKGHLKYPGYIAIVFEKAQIIPFRGELLDFARLTGRELAHNGGKDRILPMVDALYLKIGVEHFLPDVTRGLPERGLRLDILS